MASAQDGNVGAAVVGAQPGWLVPGDVLDDDDNDSEGPHFDVTGRAGGGYEVRGDDGRNFQDS